MIITKCDRCKKEADIEDVIQIGFYSDGRPSTKKVDLCAKCLRDYYNMVPTQLAEYELLLGTKFLNTNE